MREREREGMGRWEGGIRTNRQIPSPYDSRRLPSAEASTGYPSKYLEFLGITSSTRVTRRYPACSRRRAFRAVRVESILVSRATRQQLRHENLRTLFHTLFECIPSSRVYISFPSAQSCRSFVHSLVKPTDILGKRYLEIFTCRP